MTGTASRSFDVVVVGGGIAGVSAAWAPARRGQRVAVVEREASLAAHSTGRSAAQFLASYGGPTSRILSAASRPFLEAGADGLTDSELLVPRNVLWVTPAGFEEQLEAKIAANETTGTPCGRLDAAGATILDVRSVRSTWAGLRTFAPDRVPVVGVDPAAPGFFWCAGEGGTGIQTSPAIATLVADLISGTAPDWLPTDLAAELSPERFPVSQ